MRDILIALVCLYFGVQNTRSLIAMPFAEWGPVQWLLAVVTLVLYAMGVFLAARVVRAMGVAQKRAKAEADRLRAEDEAGAAEKGDDSQPPPA